MRRLTLFALYTVLGVTLAFPACGPKKKPSARQRAAEQDQKAAEIVKMHGVKLYPGTEIVDQSVKSSKTPVPGTDQPAKTSNIKVAAVTGIAEAPVDAIRTFYENVTPYTITEEKNNGMFSFVQMANVDDFNKALAQRATPIILINLRRRILTENERLAYQNELNALANQAQLDSVQQQRKAQLQRFLGDNTFIQINVRTRE